MKPEILKTLTCLAYSHGSNLDDIIQAYNIGLISGKIEQLSQEVGMVSKDETWGIDYGSEVVGSN